LRQQWSSFKANDILLGDKAFCNYLDLRTFKDRSVGSVLSLAQPKPFTVANVIKVLGGRDLLIQWQKPKKSRDAAYSEGQWKALPEQLTLRQINVVVSQPGFRGLFFILSPRCWIR